MGWPPPASAAYTCDVRVPWNPDRRGPKRAVIEVQASFAAALTSSVAVPMTWTTNDAVPTFFGSLMTV